MSTSNNQKNEYLLKEIDNFYEAVQKRFAEQLFEVAEPEIKPTADDLTATCVAFDLLMIFTRLNFYHEMVAADLVKFVDWTCAVTPLTKEQIATLCDRLGANENAMLNELGYFAYGGIIIDVFFCTYDYIAPKERRCKNLDSGEGIAKKIFKVPEIHTAALSFELAPMFVDMGRDLDNIRKKYLNYDE